jgi:hypothetical protein
VRFEDLVGEQGEAHWRGVFEYLELDWEPDVLERFSNVQLHGRFGDPTGIHRYTSLSTEPLRKWEQSFRGPVRQIWVSRWLKRLGPAPLEIMGYDPDELLRDAQAAGSARADQVAMDAVLLAGSAARRLFRKQALRISDVPRLLGEQFDPRPRATVELLGHMRRFLLGRR